NEVDGRNKQYEHGYAHQPVQGGQVRLPRIGVPVVAVIMDVAQRLQAQLRLFPVGKLHMPLGKSGKLRIKMWQVRTFNQLYKGLALAMKITPLVKSEFIF